MSKRTNINRNKLLKTLYLSTAIFVAALFIGSAVTVSIARNVTTTENKILSIERAPQSSISPQENTKKGIGEVPILSEPFYASNIYPTPHTTIKFNAATPGSPIPIGTYGSSTTDFLCGGTFDNNGVWWACQYSTTSSNIYTVDTATGVLTLVGAAGVPLTGISFDKSTGVMYACYTTALYTINMANGLATLVGPMTGRFFIDLAFDGAHNLYGIDISDESLYSINPATAVPTLIGSTGLTLNYAQDMCYDIDNGILYHAAYIYPGSFAALYTLNTATGLATLVGNFPSSYEVDAFAIPYSTTPPNNPPDTPAAPTGPTSGSIGVSYSFSATTTDPDGDNVSYLFDWGDGNQSIWLGPYSSGGTVTTSYAWASAGSYDVTVKAKDTHDAESGWSPAHTITITAAAPVIEIGAITGGLFKVKAVIKNTGTGAATNVSWGIKLTGGIIILGKQTNGTIATLAAGGNQSVTSKLILGLGKTVITVTADSATKTQNAMVLLIFIKTP